MNMHPTILRNLAEDELERYAYIEQARPSLRAFDPQVDLYDRIEVLQGEKERLKNEVGTLEDQVEELENEVEELKEKLKAKGA